MSVQASVTSIDLRPPPDRLPPTGPPWEILTARSETSSEDFGTPPREPFLEAGG